MEVQRGYRIGLPGRSLSHFGDGEAEVLLPILTLYEVTGRARNCVPQPPRAITLFADGKQEGQHITQTCGTPASLSVQHDHVSLWRSVVSWLVSS